MGIVILGCLLTLLPSKGEEGFFYSLEITLLEKGEKLEYNVWEFASGWKKLEYISKDFGKVFIISTPTEIALLIPAEEKVYITSKDNGKNLESLYTHLKYKEILEVPVNESKEILGEKCLGFNFDKDSIFFYSTRLNKILYVLTPQFKAEVKGFKKINFTSDLFNYPTSFKKIKLASPPPILQNIKD